MKLSIAWIFDHIDADWRTININELVAKFNATTAEIEKVVPVSFNMDQLTLARIIDIKDQFITVHSAEWDAEYRLPARQNAAINQWYLIKKSDNDACWLSMSHLGSSKDHLLPALYVDESHHAGAWKKTTEQTDYILEVDNKSITHRPDLWGHRGFAREVAALLNLPFKPFSALSLNIPIEQYDKEAKPTVPDDFSVKIDAHACTRFAGLTIPDITYRPPLIQMALRLARVDARPIDAIVDCTNYVMLETSQPMHAFDAKTISSKKIMPRMAHEGEKLLLLDGQTVTLTCNDLVISDGKQPIALAGIMGGASTAISPKTTAIFVESACFDATTIRRTATRCKLRTEASARFEKTLDPNQNIDALARFITLIYNAGLISAIPARIISCGKPAPTKTIPVLYEFLQSRLGAQLEIAQIVETLERLEFIVDQVDSTACIVTVPSFRAAKDISIKEDIVEEVGRFYGYTNIIVQLPSSQLAPSPLHAVYQRRKIKSVLATTLQMHELENYSFYDEDFLRRLQWQPIADCISVQSPVSENWRRLVTSLMPHLFKAVEQNSADYDNLRFFEWGRIWHKENVDHKVTAIEQKRLVGIFFDKKNSVDFYDAKALLNRFFESLDLPVSWQQVENPTDPWFTPYQTAHIHHNDTPIGMFGVINPLFLQSVSPGYACAFELDGDFLLHYKPALKRYHEPSKYPSVERDISVLVSLQYTVASLIDMIKKAHTNIINVTLIDCFEKKEWINERALTFRLIIQDSEKTLTKDDVEHIYHIVATLCKGIGATIR
jgi:phenylalanyl-tRNA synthetase beta chain